MFAAIRNGIALAACLGAPLGARAACNGPRAMETALRTHPGAQAYIQLGSWFGKQGQYDCAAETFRAALRQTPDSAQLHYYLGLSLASDGQAKDALHSLQRSVDLDSSQLKPHLLLADILKQLHRESEAEAQWKAALRIAPESTVALDSLSKSFIADGDFDSAIQLLHSSPPAEELFVDLAVAYDKAGRFDQAAATASSALRANPSSFALTDTLATVQVHQRRLQDAIATAEKFSQKHPDNVDAQVLYLRVLVAGGNSTAAMPIGRKLFAVAPHNFQVQYLNGVLARQAGDYSAAREHLEQAVALDPGDSDAHYNLGLVLAKLHDPGGARARFEESITLGATDPKVHFELASVLRELGETAQAEEQIKLYQQQLQTNALREQAADDAAQAEAALSAGDAKKAMALYRTACEADPQNALLAYKLAMAMDRTGDVVAERAALDNAVQIDPSFALAQNQLGYLASRAGDLASAEKHFRMAVDNAPGFAEAWINLAATLGMESHLPEARAAVATALRIDPRNAQAQQLDRQLAAQPRY